AEVLELSGHETRAAYDGPKGIDLARTFHPDVLICDIGLPQMDGYDVARALRADEKLKDIYLIALSGYAQAEDLKRAAEAGFQQHVAKPPNIKRIDRLLADMPAEFAGHMATAMRR